MAISEASLRRTSAVAAATAVAVASAWGAALAPAAWAHDSVIGGVPANGEVVESFPSSLELEFSGQPKEGFNTFALSRVGDGAPEVLFSGEPTVEDRWVKIDLPAEVTEQASDAPGEYRIGFQIISSDGHATKGMTTFTYAPAGTQVEVAAQATTEPGTAETDTETDTGTDTGGPGNGWKLVLAIVALLVVAGMVIAALGKRKKIEEEGDAA